MHDFVRFSGVALMSAGLCIAATLSRAAPAQNRGKTARAGVRTVLKSERDYLVGAADSPLVAGAKVDLLFQNGKRLDGMVVTDVRSGTADGTLRSLGVKSSKGKRQNIRPDTVARILIARKPFDVLLDADSNEFVLLDLARRDEVVAERLRSSGQRLWSGPSQGGPYRTVAEYKRDYVDKVQALFRDQAFQLNETQYFLFYSNISPDQAEGVVADLDRMYVELGKLFGLLKETNIWRGKCVVLAFAEKSEFERCEVEVMGRPPNPTAQGLCHPFEDGKVVVTCYRGSDPNFFRSMLVHETTHGFVHLYRSNAGVPSWINEGLADWVANLVVSESTVVPRRQRDALAKARAMGSMGGMFNAQGNIDVWQYGLASGLTEFLIQTNLQAYGGLITLVKEGVTWQDALRELYGVTPEELAAEYGRSNGLAGLQP